MRRVLSGLSLFVFCCTLALAQPPKGGGKTAKPAMRPAAVKVQPTLFEQLWRQLTGWMNTNDDPGRGQNPVPTDDPGRGQNPVPT